MKLLIYIAVLILSTTAVGADNPPELQTESKPIAVLPFINYSGQVAAINTIDSLLHKSLNEKLGSYYSSEELRPFLRKNRIRNTGEISSNQALQLQNSLGVKYLILGSYDLYNRGRVKEIGLSLRVIEITTMRVLYIKSVSASDMDYIKIFGFGRIESMDKLCQKVIDDLTEGLSLKWLEQQSLHTPTNFKVAVVDFDNFSRMTRAGSIAANYVLSYLHQQGLEVIEPGVTKDIMISNKAYYRGAIELESIKELNQLYDVDLIFTGTVDEFKFPQGNEGVGTPEAEIEIRVLDASIGNILYVESKYQRGIDSEKSFQLGRFNSLGKMSQKMVTVILRKFLKDFSYAATN